MPKVFGSQPSVRSAGTTYEACRRSLAIRFTESRFRNEATGPVLLDMGLQRLLHLPWALESASHMGGGQGIKFRLCQSASVFVFVCLRLRLPTSSYISVFVCLCDSATVVCALTVCAIFHAVRVKAIVVL